MKTKYKITSSLLVLMLLTSVISFSNNIDKGKLKKTKTVEKEFVVSDQNTVDITNKYGDLTITTWDKNTVSIVVTITVSSNDDEAVQEKLDNINIEFNQANNTVYAKTLIKSSKTKWSWFGSEKSVEMSIDYEIKMPLSNHVDLENDYGSIYIDKLEGKSKIDCDYGSIHLGELHNKFNDINMDYGHASNIEYMNSGKINSDYSNISVEKANNLVLSADYTHFEINDVDKVSYNNDYGSLKIAKAKVVEGSGDYLTFKVNEIIKKLEIDSDYGSIKIYKLYKDFDKVTIDANYTGIKIGIETDASFNFKTTTSYADITFEDLNVDITHKEVKTFSKNYTGNINGKNPNSILNIDSSYGGIKLFIAD